MPASDAQYGGSDRSHTVPPKAETHAERQLRLQAKADELQDRIDHSGCVWVLKNHPKAVSWAKRQFETKGWWPSEEDLMKECRNRASSTSTVAKAEKTPVKGEEQDLEEEQASSDAPSSHIKLEAEDLHNIDLHRNYNTWLTTPGTHRTHLDDA